MKTLGTLLLIFAFLVGFTAWRDRRAHALHCANLYSEYSHNRGDGNLRAIVDECGTEEEQQ